MKNILILVWIILTDSCVDTNGTADISYYHKVVSESKSPDGKRTLTLNEYGADTINCHTQVSLEFYSGGAGVYAVQGRNLDIKTWWKDNKTIVIETRKEYLAPHQKRNKIQRFSDIIRVVYIEK